MGCSLNVAVAWAVSAKNSLANVYGYSPNQLVFGRNLNFPSILTDKLPASDEKTNSEVLLDNLNALHAARKAFVLAEADERIRGALRSKTRTSTSLVFQNGQSVYYKRADSLEWKGPGIVIGKENQTVFVKHESAYVCVHPSRLLPENSEFCSQITKESITQTPTGRNQSIPEDPESNIWSKECHMNDENDERTVEVNISEDDSDNTYEEEGHDVSHRNKDIEDFNAAAEQQNSQEISTPSEEASTQEFLGPSKLPKGKTMVIARTKNNEWKTYNIISRAGKSIGKYSTWLNVEDNSTKEIKSVDWKDYITEWKEVESQEILISEAQPTCSFELLDAKLKELEKWKQFDVYNEVLDNGQNIISVRWVCSTKDGEVKARLCTKVLKTEKHVQILLLVPNKIFN